MDIVYKIDNDLKQEYLLTKPTGTAQSESFILRSVDDYESMVGEKVYNFSIAETRELIYASFNNSSIASITKNVSIVTSYVDFCIKSGVVSHMENRFKTFTSVEAKNFLSKQAIKNRYISEEMLKNYTHILYNPQDQLIFNAVYEGVWGDNDLEELVNLRMRDVNKEHNLLTLTKNDGRTRQILVSDNLIKLIEDAYECDEYIESNSIKSSNDYRKLKELQVNKVEDFVLRKTGKNEHDQITYHVLKRRMFNFKKWLDNEFLTFNNLYQSGMMNMAKKIFLEKGELTRDDYIDICIRYNYREDAEISYMLVDQLFQQYRSVLIDDSEGNV
jgi:site-specific recombinase XerD